MIKVISFLTIAGCALVMATQIYAQTPADALVPPAAEAQTTQPSAPAVNATADMAVTTATPLASGTQVASIPPIVDLAGLSPVEQEVILQTTFVKPPVEASDIPSLFFSVWEHDLILDARRGLNTRPPGDDDGTQQIVESPREISLSGIVYSSSKDWTIWINEMRISPNRIPTEIMDLKVYKDYIQLEWFDAQTNQIFPVKLRTHQRFNLDARMFLPG